MTALSMAALRRHSKCVVLLLRHMTKEDVLKKTYVRPFIARSDLPHPTFFVGSSPSPCTALDTIDLISHSDEIAPRACFSNSLSFFSRRNVLSLRPSVRILTSPHVSFLVWSRTKRPPRSGHRDRATRTASRYSKSTGTDFQSLRSLIIYFLKNFISTVHHHTILYKPPWETEHAHRTYVWFQSLPRSVTLRKRPEPFKKIVWRTRLSLSLRVSVSWYRGVEA